MSQQIPMPEGFPTIVCLCGSTRFGEAFDKANLALTLEGKIVLSIGYHKESDNTLFDKEPETRQLDIRLNLNALHVAKIILADYVYVINVDGYIGEGTRNEIRIAKALGKPVEYLEAPNAEVTESLRY